MGGENDVRGFEIWGVSPIAFVPIEASVDRAEQRWQPAAAEGTSIRQRQSVLGQRHAERSRPINWCFPGGDTALVANFEYRIPIFGPVTLAAFFDAGMNRLLNTSQLKLNPERITQLNGEFPEAAFADKAVIAPGTQKIRASTGLELQVLMPVVNAPFRIYWAYNPWSVTQYLQPPIVADRSYFPNQASFLNALVAGRQHLSVFRETVACSGSRWAGRSKRTAVAHRDSMREQLFQEFRCEQEFVAMRC